MVSEGMASAYRFQPKKKVARRCTQIKSADLHRRRMKIKICVNLRINPR